MAQDVISHPGCIIAPHPSLQLALDFSSLAVDTCDKAAAIEHAEHAHDDLFLSPYLHARYAAQHE